MFDGFMDLLTVLLVTRYRTRPLHFFGIPGAIIGAFGMLVLMYLSFLWMLGDPIGERPLLTLGVLLVIIAVQFLGIGLLAELLVGTSIRSAEIFSIREEREATPEQIAAFQPDNSLAAAPTPTAVAQISSPGLPSPGRMISAPPSAATRPTTAPPTAMPQPRNATLSNPVVPQPRAASSSNRGLQVDINTDEDEDGEHATVSIEKNPFHRPQR
jgi:hypothetical protein